MKIDVLVLTCSSRIQKRLRVHSLELAFFVEFNFLHIVIVFILYIVNRFCENESAIISITLQ